MTTPKINKVTGPTWPVLLPGSRTSRVLVNTSYRYTTD